MCGIAGILFKSLAEGRNQTTGQALIDMLDGCQHRGPDSTGFALYGDAEDGRVRLRLFVGTGERAAEAVEAVKEILARHGAEIVDDEVIGNNYRVVVSFTGETWKMAYDLERVAPVISVGSRKASPAALQKYSRDSLSCRPCPSAQKAKNSSWALTGRRA